MGVNNTHLMMSLYCGNLMRWGSAYISSYSIVVIDVYKYPVYSWNFRIIL